MFLPGWLAKPILLAVVLSKYICHFWISCLVACRVPTLTSKSSRMPLSLLSMMHSDMYQAGPSLNAHFAHYRKLCIV